MDPVDVRRRANELPREPGIYRFLDGDTVLYIGKAVDLRNRVRSYADPASHRARKMVQQASEIDIAVTETETQALLLEANLIKRQYPRFNVRLKDDKSYPLVQLTNHDFPRIEVTRDPDDSATVFGPYTDRQRLDTVVKAIRDVYGLRGCSDHKFADRDRPCLDYDIGLCTAPCTGEIGWSTYNNDVNAVEQFFGGDINEFSQKLEEAMADATVHRAFERAASIRDRLRAVESFHQGQGAAISDASDRETIDVLGAAIQGREAIVALLRSDHGKLVDRERHHLSIPVDARSVDGHGPIFSAFISQYYAERSLPDVILVPEDPTDTDLRDWLHSSGVCMRIPSSGRENTMIELAIKNASRVDTSVDPISELGEALNINRPRRIEGFDISHAQGVDPVGANVVFVDGEPDKSGYRRRQLPPGNDDYANMRRLLEWRITRSVEGRDNRPVPDLILIDGGQGQVNAAMSIIKSTDWDVPIIGIAKPADKIIIADKHIQWAPTDPKLHVLQRVRDEAHRFAVQYHQLIRDEITSELDNVPGIGPDRRSKLLNRFGSVDGIRAATDDQLLSVPGIGPTTIKELRRRIGSGTTVDGNTR